MKVCIKGTGADDCGCKNWLKGIRTINGQYPDDNRDFDINAGNGIRITPATAGITITNDATPSSFIEGDNIEITPSGDDKVIALVSDPIINGDLQVNGDIIQNGSAYETHAEQVYTTKDYIITRDGAISALSAGDYSGFQVKKYDGTNDGRLVIDNAGVARVGDVGDEQPLLTRDESASLNNGDLLQWNSTAQKAVSASVNTSQIVRGSGNIGSDTKPIKIVNGVATPITNALQTQLIPSVQVLTPRNDITGITITSRDSSPTACRFITYGDIAILNIAIQVTGTRSGASNWYDIFPDLDLSDYYAPFMIGNGPPSELYQGHQLYFANGSTYNYSIDTQIIFIHV